MSTRSWLWMVQHRVEALEKVEAKRQSAETNLGLVPQIERRLRALEQAGARPSGGFVPEPPAYNRGWSEGRKKLRQERAEMEAMEIAAKAPPRPKLLPRDAVGVIVYEAFSGAGRLIGRYASIHTATLAALESACGRRYRSVECWERVTPGTWKIRWSSSIIPVSPTR